MAIPYQHTSALMRSILCLQPTGVQSRVIPYFMGNKSFDRPIPAAQQFFQTSKRQPAYRLRTRRTRIIQARKTFRPDTTGGSKSHQVAATANRGEGEAFGVYLGQLI